MARLAERTPWSIAQVVSLLAGGTLVVLGVLALLRTGLDFSTLTGTEVTVAGLHHTTLLGLVEVATGLLLVLLGAVPGGAREGMAFVGVVAMGLGILVLVEPQSFHGALGTHPEHGWAYLAGGAVVVLTALASPAVWRRSRGPGVFAR